MKRDPRAASTCLETEFRSRQDGFPGMAAKYGFDPAAVPAQILQTGIIYQATANGNCAFGEVFTTDGRIKALDLMLLDDDKKFFPLYNVAPVFATKTLEKNPQLSDLFGPVSKKLTNETMIELNAKVDVDGENPSDVAFDWLKKEGFIK